MIFLICAAFALLDSTAPLVKAMVKSWRNLFLGELPQSGLTATFITFHLLKNQFVWWPQPPEIRQAFLQDAPDSDHTRPAGQPPREEHPAEKSAVIKIGITSSNMPDYTAHPLNQKAKF